MSFCELDIQACYDSDKDDILNDFYIPVLKETKEYWRLTGFFSSTSLAIAARGVSDLLQNDGVMKIIVGAVLTKDDVEAIIEGKENPKKIIEKFPFNDLNNIEDQAHQYLVVQFLLISLSMLQGLQKFLPCLFFLASTY